jgi:hypothetical protein
VFKPKGIDMSASNNRTTDEAAIRELVESWARALRARDLDGILTNHSADMLMFDVPPPVESKGIEAYRKTWDLFFSWSDDPVVFDITNMEITAGARCCVRCCPEAVCWNGEEWRENRTRVSSDNWSAQNRRPMDGLA